MQKPEFGLGMITCRYMYFNENYFYREFEYVILILTPTKYTENSGISMEWVKLFHHFHTQQWFGESRDYEFIPRVIHELHQHLLQRCFSRIPMLNNLQICTYILFEQVQLPYMVLIIKGHLLVLPARTVRPSASVYHPWERKVICELYLNLATVQHVCRILLLMVSHARDNVHTAKAYQIFKIIDKIAVWSVMHLQVHIRSKQYHFKRQVCILNCW